MQIFPWTVFVDIFVVVVVKILKFVSESVWPKFWYGFDEGQTEELPQNK